MNRKIIDYVLLADDGSLVASQMPQIVMSWIKQGWQPFGGLCYNAGNNTIYQAMVKYEEDTPKYKPSDVANIPQL